MKQRNPDNHLNGFRTYSEGISHYRQLGQSNAEIAKSLGITVHAVEALDRPPTRRKARGSSVPPIDAQIVTLPKAVFEAVTPHAQRRGITVQTFVNRLVFTAISEGLVDAVLDDGARP